MLAVSAAVLVQAAGELACTMPLQRSQSSMLIERTGISRDVDGMLPKRGERNYLQR